MASEAEEIQKQQNQNEEEEEKEWEKVSQMRGLVEGKHPDAKEVDNLTLRRFLRARNQDIDKASAMFLKHLQWRREAVPNGFISAEEVRNELSQNKVYMGGIDREGRPILVGFAARHYYSKRNMDDFKRFVVYFLDKICARIPEGHEKYLCIADFKGWGYSNCDIKAYMAALDIMQNYYPERLGKALMVNTPYIFMKAWKIVYPFIDDNTKEKFVFVDSKDIQSTLLEDIDESQLPDIYNGKFSLTPLESSRN